uniref:Uncharacterized protein n=1 Tax=Anopheles farauti TaxID=69004 RepID=A0A182QA12_9DIPT
MLLGGLWHDLLVFAGNFRLFGVLHCPGGCSVQHQQHQTGNERKLGNQEQNTKMELTALVLLAVAISVSAIRVDWNTNTGPIVPPTSTPAPVPQPPFREPAPVWEDQSDDIPNPNPYSHQQHAQSKYDKYDKLNGKYNPKLKKYKAYEKVKYMPYVVYYDASKQQFYYTSVPSTMVVNNSV